MELDQFRNETPIIETGRLTLRAHRIGDLRSCVALWSDPVVNRFISAQPSSEAQTWSRMLAYLGHWRIFGFGYWAVEENATHRYIGEVGFADFKRNIDVALNGLPEIGWAIAPSYWQRGFATEAVRAVAEWGDKYFRDSFCLVHPQNFASIRIAKNFGYVESRRIHFKDVETLVFTRQLKGADK